MNDNRKKALKEINEYKDEMLAKYKDLIVLYENSREIYEKIIDEYKKLEIENIVDTEFSYTIENNEITITGYNGSNVDIIIPVTMQDLPVTTIDSSAFEGNTTLKSINTSNVTTIRNKAFAFCSSLENAIMPEVALVDQVAFLESNVKYIDLPKVTTLNDESLSLCVSLESINLSKNLSTIGINVFSGSTLQNLTIDYGNEDISKVNTYTWSEFVSNLTGWDLTTIPGKYVKNNIYINDLGNGFYYRENANELTLIDYAGLIAPALANITLPASINTKPVTTIGSYVFKGFTSLISINVTDVVTIGGFAFGNCSKLISVIGNKVTSLGVGTFQGCVKLENITLPEVLSIDQSTFSSNSSLTNVDLPKLTSIKGEFAFLGCTNLTSINFENIIDVPNYTFVSCIKLSTVNIPQAKTIGEGAFMYCESLDSINLPLAKILGVSSFAYCIKLKDIELKNVKVLNANAFNDCKELNKIVISKDAITIGTDIFTNCPISSVTAYYGTEDISAITINDWNDFVSSIGLVPYNIPDKYVMNDYAIRELS